MSTNLDHTTNDPSVRVVSYNLLSTHLAKPSYHTKCDPCNLKAKNRLPKILSKLETELTQSADTPVIFCLQEVSHDWASALHVFFAENGYHMITALYGRHFNGYMGIATAYPVKYFKTLEVDLNRLSDKRIGGWPREPREEQQKPSFLSKYLLNPVYSRVRGLFTTDVKTSDAWEISERRSNQFIAIRLENRNGQKGEKGPFWIANYHMPCSFREPMVMTIHSEMVAKHIQSLAEKTKDSYILAGDFNILPESSHYGLLTTGTFDKRDPSYPPNKFGVHWESTIEGMRSAYADFNGKESDFTNYAFNEGSEECFIGTLDYIFLSDSWKVTKVEALAHRDDVNGPFPNDKEPSDHVLIAADLEF